MLNPFTPFGDCSLIRMANLYANTVHVGTAHELAACFDLVTSDGVLGNINIEATGPWAETILWEVPLMACLSEIYFHTDATDWSYDGQAGTHALRR